jgi:membrane-bound lytic murein transglycosylase A
MRKPFLVSCIAFLAGFACVAGLSGCATRAPEHAPEGFAAVDWKDVGTFVDAGDFGAFRAALAASLAWARDQPEETPLSFGDGKIPMARVRASLEELARLAEAAPDTATFVALTMKKFTAWKAVAAEGKRLLVTGYYVPEIAGSLEPDPAFPVPVYGVPDDLVSVPLGEFLPELQGRVVRGRRVKDKILPYWPRSAIRKDGVLDGRAPVIAWARSEWDTFVMEVQGSGVLRLPDGTERLLGYAEQNGQSYKAVGKLLLDEKRIPKERMSMQAIGAWLEANPGQTRRVLDSNPSFVFFRTSEGKAKGSLGFALTPERSVAVDMRRFPAGAPALLRTEKPLIDAGGKVASGGVFARLVFNQDTGGAIRGFARADFFWGQGKTAFEKAGAMQHPGEYFLLLVN